MASRVWQWPHCSIIAVAERNDYSATLVGDLSTAPFALSASQVREAVFSTHKGHILSAALKQRAVLEEMHAVHISTAVPGAQRRTLKQETTDDLGAYPYDGMHGFGHCYFSSNFSMYR